MTQTTRQQPMCDDFGDELTLALERILPLDRWFEVSHAMVRFVCDGVTDKYFEEDTLKYFGFIE